MPRSESELDVGGLGERFDEDSFTKHLPVAALERMGSEWGRVGGSGRRRSVLLAVREAAAIDGGGVGRCGGERSAETASWTVLYDLKRAATAAAITPEWAEEHGLRRRGRSAWQCCCYCG